MTRNTAPSSCRWSRKKPDIVVATLSASTRRLPPARPSKRVARRFLPAYAPELDPIEMPFAKIKAVTRSAAARCLDTTCPATAKAPDAVSPTECSNDLRHAGYHTDGPCLGPLVLLPSPFEDRRPRGESAPFPSGSRFSEGTGGHPERSAGGRFPKRVDHTSLTSASQGPVLARCIYRKGGSSPVGRTRRPCPIRPLSARRRSLRAIRGRWRGCRRGGCRR